VAAHDPVALAEIDLYGELMIAAAATPFERLPADRIDEVLRVASGPERRSERYYQLTEVEAGSDAEGEAAEARAATEVPVQAQVPAQRTESRR